jgi:hypothetical protein
VKIELFREQVSLGQSHRSTFLWCAFLIVSVAVMLFLPCPQPALAQGQGMVKLSAQAGFDGYCKEGRWLPVRVTVENAGAGVSAQIQLINKTDAGQPPFAAADLSLPGPSRKELFFSVYPQNFYGGLQIRVTADGKTLAQTDLKITCLGADDLLIGLLTDTPSAYSALAAVKPLSGSAKVAQLSFSDLPDQATGWAGLDALVLSGVDTGSLSGAQRQALELWVADGGRLFIVGGTKWQGAAAGLGNLLPVELHGTQKVSNLAALTDYFRISAPLAGETTLAVGTLRPQAYLLVAQDGLPLLVEKNVGFGQVYFFAADPGLQPLSRWDGMRVIYEWTLARKSFNLWDTAWNTDTANQALSVLPALGVPSILASCGWMLVYLLVIGPGNYFFLRRLKRMELAWITIPVLVIIFTLVSYGIGSLSRGTRPILNRMAIAFSWDGVSQAQVRGLAGVYSPNRAKYDLEAKTPFVPAPLDNSSTGWGTLQQGTGLLVPDLAVEIGGMKTLALDGTQPALALKQDLSFQVTASGVTLTGSLTNATPFTIEAAVLRLPSASQDLGDIAPGETRQIQVDLPYTNSPLTSIFSQGSYDPYALYNNNSTNDDTGYRRELLTQALSHQRPAEVDWGGYLVGWVKSEALPVSLGAQPVDAQDTSLVLVRLNPVLQLSEGVLTIPNSFMYREASTNDYPSSYANLQIPAGGYYLRFWPALPIQFGSVKALRLHQEINIPSSANFTLSLWNYASEQWDPVDDLSQTQIDLPHPEEYVGPGGELRLKLEGSSQDYVNVNRLDFELTVNR